MCLMAIKINVQRSIEEFDFAGLEITANYSDENIAKMFSLKDSDLQEKAEKEAAKLSGIDNDDISEEDFMNMVNTCLDLYGEIYAPVFGEGEFKKAYNHIQSVTATIKAFEEAIDYVTAKAERENKEFENRTQKKIDKIKNRKKKK